MSASIIQTTKASRFFRMPAGEGHYFARVPEARFWGQLDLIHFLTLLSAKWRLLAPSRPFGLGDLANEDGSAMSDHESHATGVAVDIFVFNKDPLKRRNGDANKTIWYDPRFLHVPPLQRPTHPEYHRELTTKLMRLIAQLSRSFPMIQCLYNDLIVLGDPEVQTMRTGAGQLRPHVNHDDHLHVLLIGGRKYAKDEVEAMLRTKHTLF